MKNAHTRLGTLEYVRATERVRTRISVNVDRYMGEGDQAHLLSVYGNDADIGAIHAAIVEKHSFTVTFPDRTVRQIALGEDPSCYRGAIALPGRKLPLRHLVAVSQFLHANGAAGKAFLLNYEPVRAWASVVSFLGLPGDPRWARQILDRLKVEGKINPIQGIGCEPVVIEATRESILDTIAAELVGGALCFPEINGPILWPAVSVQDALRIPSHGVLSL